MAKDSDLEEFIKRASDVQEKINGLVTGRLKPEEVVVPGEKTPEQRIAEDKARKIAEEKLEIQQAKRAKQAAEEEKKRWWTYAEVEYGDSHDKDPSPSSINTPSAEMKKAKREEIHKERMRRLLDYSRWDEWLRNPDDPVSLV
jgi:hypothetical protein